MSDEFDEVIDTAAPCRGATPCDPPVARYHPSAARLMSRLYASASAPLRAKMIASMVRPLSSLATAVIAAGAFVGFLRRDGNEGQVIGPEDVARYTNKQILELAQFVEQVSPAALRQVAAFVAEKPVGITAFGVSVALLLLHLLRSNATRRP
jgi:hypothetical protein